MAPLKSLQGIQRAEPDPALYGKIRSRVLQETKMQVIRRPYLAMAAACLTLLISANIWAISHRSPAFGGPAAYQVEAANFNLY